MATIHLETLARDIEIKPYTRAIARAVNEKLLEGVVVRSGDNGQQTDIPAVNADRSEELAVQLITGLSRDEVGSLSVEEYNTLKDALNEATAGKKKG